MKILKMIALVILVLAMAGGCAKLPLDNGAPGRPMLESTGIRGAYGVEFLIVVDDPDNDKVTVHFQAVSPTDGVQDFFWSSFIDSGEQASFFLNLGLGPWTVTATARDEWDEASPAGELELTVTI